MHSIDLESGQITQVLDGVSDGVYENACGELFYGSDGGINAIDVQTRKERTIYPRPPAGFSFSGFAPGCDGKTLLVALRKKDDSIDLSGLGQDYRNLKELFLSRPLCRLVAVSIENGKQETMHEELNLISHINASPTRGNLFTFCHEGPWRIVEQRIWCADIATGKTWPVRPQKRPEDAIGHEFWLADGEHVAFQAWMPEGPLFGYTRCDNTGGHEQVLTAPSEHFHANAPELVVGDGMRALPYLLLWRLSGGKYEGPRVLCRHRCSRHVQWLHVHPRFSPGGDYVLYTSDTTGYGNLFQVFIPAFEKLPLLEEIQSQA